MYPILFKIGPITVYSYGTLVALASIITSFLIIKSSEKYGLSKREIWDLLFYIFISGIIGARLLHIFLNLNYYKNNLMTILMLHKGGLAIQGAILGGICGGTFFLLRNRLPIWKTGDLIMKYFPLGQAIGRIGCFLNGCCYGKFNHPTQLYSSLALFIIFLILRYISKRRRFDGQLFLSYFLLYGPIRFSIDFLRGDLSVFTIGLTQSQLISILFFVIALLIYLLKIREKI